jgi:hypothetical protein
MGSYGSRQLKLRDADLLMPSSPFDRPPTLIIQLQLCTVTFFEEGCVRTQFRDNSTFEGWPHDIDNYHQIAQRVGCGTIERYCQEHDFCHNFLAQEIKHNVSTVLWPMAHGAPVPRYEGLGEEALVQMFQRWLSDYEEPLLEGPYWLDLRNKALAHLRGVPNL